MESIDKTSSQNLSSSSVYDDVSSETSQLHLSEYERMQEDDVSISEVKKGGNKMMGAFIRGLLRKLSSYTQKLTKQLENQRFEHILNNLDIKSIQAGIDEPKLKAAKRRPMQGENLYVEALARIHRIKQNAETRDPQELTHRQEC